MKVTVDDILNKIDDEVEKPFITACFNDNWKEHAKANYDLDSVISIAWKNGRKAILLERALRKMEIELNSKK